jgi:hypothetical protein
MYTNDMWTPPWYPLSMWYCLSFPLFICEFDVSMFQYGYFCRCAVFWHYARCVSKWMRQAGLRLFMCPSKVIIVRYDIAELCSLVRRVWRYQRGNQNPYIEEEQTTHWPKEKVQKDKQRSIKHTYKTKDRVTRTPLKPGSELRCSGRVSSSCSTSGTSHVNLLTNPVISHEWGKDREVFTTSGTYRGHLWHRYSIAVNQVMVAT